MYFGLEYSTAPQKLPENIRIGFSEKRGPKKQSLAMRFWHITPYQFITLTK